MTSQHPHDWHPDDYVYRPSAAAKGDGVLEGSLKAAQRDG